MGPGRRREFPAAAALGVSLAVHVAAAAAFATWGFSRADAPPALDVAAAHAGREPAPGESRADRWPPPVGLRDPLVARPSPSLEPPALPAPPAWSAPASIDSGWPPAVEAPALVPLEARPSRDGLPPALPSSRRRRERTAAGPAVTTTAELPEAYGPPPPPADEPSVLAPPVAEGVAGGASLPIAAAGPSEVLAPVPSPDNPPPEYPPESLRAREEGLVVVRATCDETGRVLAVELLEGSGHERLDAAALAAVRGWRFEPAREDGVAVAGLLDLPIRFFLRTP